MPAFRKIWVLLGSLLFATAASAQVTVTKIDDNTTRVEIRVAHAHWAKPVVETYKIQCPHVLYELELTLEPKKLILHTQNEGASITTDLSDTQLLKDWRNGRYVWTPVFLCLEDILQFHLQGIDLNEGRNNLKIVSAYSEIVQDGKLAHYETVRDEPRDHLFRY